MENNEKKSVYLVLFYIFFSNFVDTELSKHDKEHYLFVSGNFIKKTLEEINF